jgi:2-amino-4-hydroxy-6-hydroxymethyldihydropteridine diphosphokinase
MSRAEAPTTVYLAFGANLGDRAGTIARAIDLLAARGVAPQARSPLYETDPVTPDPQPHYLNAVVRAETALGPPALLALCLEVEHALGRRRPAGRAPAPREIDIDLLLYGVQVIADPPALLVPHPRLLERPFVRIPLRDVAAPGLRHPVTGEPLDRAAPDPSVRRA